ncbi:MAG: ABC transporter permease [Pyrinomonadaceae bacterium]|nr:ABC transporter permease [Pyrinomonadaceae bacterium]
MRIIWQDVRYGARMLLKNPGFTLVAVLALALGIGANTAIFSVVNAVLLRPLPYKNAERLVMLYSENRSTTAVNAPSDAPISYPDFVDYKKQSQTLQYLAAYAQVGTALTSGGDEPERVYGADVSAEIFPMLGANALVGRTFTPEEDRPGATPVIVISHGLWQRRFGADPKVVGQEIQLGARSVTLIGVMPPDFKFPVQAEKSDFWMPFATEIARTYAASMENRDARFVTVVAALKPAATLEQAQAELKTLAAQLQQQYPEVNTGWGIRVSSLHEAVVGDVRPALLVLLGAVGFVLLIACANVANLLLARSSARGKEIAIRTALGASRTRVVRQLLTESLLLAFVGGVLGLLLALWGVDLLVAASPANLPRLAEIGLDGRVLVFTFGVSVLTGIIFGVAPALQASKLELNETLKEGGRGSTEGARRNRVRSLLIITEIALSLMLLIGAGLLLKSFMRLLDTDPGYDAAHALSVTLPVSRSKYAEPEKQTAYFQTILQRVKALPGVETAGATNLLPLGNRDTFNTFNIEGRPPAAPGARTAARDARITPDYFRAMNIPLRRGRDFTERDASGSPPVIMINEAFARKYFKGEDPLGKRMLLDDDEGNPEPPREIVGVVGNTHHSSLDAEESEEYYVPFLQIPDRQMELVVRSSASEPSALAPAVRNAIKEADKDQLIWEMKTMEERVAQSIAPRKFNATLLGAFALVALLLAVVGIYGVMAYSVAQRTHEIGIRIALGAQKSDVVKMIIGQGMLLASIGVGLGLIGALALSRVMTSLLYGVSATDPLTFGGISLLLTSAALLACYIPARRAMRVDPMIALRYE